jgi:hypothetical protein
MNYTHPDVLTSSTEDREKKKRQREDYLAQQAPASPYCKFVTACMGFKFYYKGSRAYLYQLFNSGYTDAEKLIRGGYPEIKVERKTRADYE